MRLQNFGRLVEVQNTSPLDESSRVLIKSSDIEVTRHLLRNIQQNKSKLSQNKQTIDSERNRTQTMESEENTYDKRNIISVQSYSFNVKNKLSVGTFSSVDQYPNFNEILGEDRQYNKMQYNLRVQSLARQYQLKIKKQKELHQLQRWKMKQQIDRLQNLVETLSKKEPQMFKQQYCHICSNGQMIIGLKRINQQLESAHEGCIKKQSQYGIKLLQLQKQVSNSRQKIDYITKQNSCLNQTIKQVQKKNQYLISDIKQKQDKIISLQNQNKRLLIQNSNQKQNNMAKQNKLSKQNIMSKQSILRPRRKLQRLTSNDISVSNPLSQHPTNSKSFTNICHQNSYQPPSYLSAMKKYNQVDPIVQRVKSLSQFHYRPSIQRKAQRRYY